MAYLFQDVDVHTEPSNPRVGDVLDFPGVFGKVVAVEYSEEFGRMRSHQLRIRNLETGAESMVMLGIRKLYSSTWSIGAHICK
jgi:hypothetical protein